MKLRHLTTAILAAAFSVTPAAAQLPISFGVSAGATLPIGDFGGLNDAGFNFGAHARLAFPLVPIAVRAEAQHNRMKFSGSDANTLVTSGTLNGEIDVRSPVMVVSPYFTAGVGGYFIQTVLRGATAGNNRYDDVTGVGLNGGVGLRMPLAGFSGFAEVRIHWVNTPEEFLTGSATYVPLVVGLTF